MLVTATEAKNRFGYVCAQAKTEPVFVEKDGRRYGLVNAQLCYSVKNERGEYIENIK